MHTKDQIQNKIVEQAVTAGSGLIILPTGVGKSRIVIEYLKRIPYKKALIVTSTEKLRDISWPAEIKKWNGNENVTIICYQSLHKFIDEEFDVVIYDEVHHVTPLNVNFFSKERKYSLGLTATEPRDEEKQWILRHVLGFSTIVKMSVEEAVSLKLISPFIITKVEMELDDIVKNVTAGSKKHSFLTTELANYQYLTDRIDAMANSFTYREKSIREMLIMKRMHFINALSSKVSVTRKILSEFQDDDRTIVFSKSIQSAKAIHPHSFHSKTTDKHLKAFIDKEINILSCVNALNEGINIPDMDNAVINQLNSNDLVLTQQLGRLIRFRKNFVGKVFIVVAKNTVDENWFQNATKNFLISETIQAC